MPSDRIQRRIDALLDEADEAVSADDWPLVANKARAVLAIDKSNADAAAFLKMAEANLGTVPAAAESAASEAPSTPSRPATEQPSSFASGRYEVRRFLGEGGKKRVFLAHDTRLDRDVAFALIKTEGLDATGRERITREAQAMGRLGAHPHVVTIFEIGDEGGSPYVVNELLAGGDVEGELQKSDGPLPLARTLEALILRLLAMVPADRPASASEVLATLEAVDPEARSAPTPTPRRTRSIASRGACSSVVSVSCSVCAPPSTRRSRVAARS